MFWCWTGGGGRCLRVRGNRRGLGGGGNRRGLGGMITTPCGHTNQEDKTRKPHCEEAQPIHGVSPWPYLPFAVLPLLSLASPTSLFACPAPHLTLSVPGKKGAGQP